MNTKEFKIGSKVHFTKKGLDYIEKNTYKPNLINDYYTIISIIEGNNIVPDYFILNDRLNNTEGLTGYFQEDIFFYPI